MRPKPVATAFPVRARTAAFSLRTAAAAASVSGHASSGPSASGLVRDASCEEFLDAARCGHELLPRPSRARAHVGRRARRGADEAPIR